VLGTSGRVLVADPTLGGGPHDVIDLATGQTLADFAGQKSEILLNAVAVPGDSGDIVMSIPHALVRVDPRDTRTPLWSTRIAGKSAWVYAMAGDTNFLPVSIELNAPNAEGYPYDPARIDLQTGVLDPGWSANALVYTETHPAVVSRYSSGQPVELTGLDPSGGTTWTRQVPPDSAVVAVRSSAGVAGADSNIDAPTDLIAVVSTTELTILDADSGAARWSVSTARCGLAPGTLGSAPTLGTVLLDTVHDAIIIVHDGTSTCTFSASTGAPQPVPDVTGESSFLFGPANTYAPSFSSGDLTAYDRQTGTKLWTSTSPPTPASTNPRWWVFAGGYLVNLAGDRVTAAG
jgi:hypothetical protein